MKGCDGPCEVGRAIVPVSEGGVDAVFCLDCATEYHNDRPNIDEPQQDYLKEYIDA